MELGIFGKKKQPEKEKKEEKEGFVFLFGRPQYDWVTGKPVEGRKFGGKDWLNRDDKKKKEGK